MKLYNLFLPIFCFIFFSFTTANKKHEKTKSIYKEYTVTDNATVAIDNKYGNLSITTWDKNNVEITVKITVKGNDLTKVNAKLNAIDVDFNATKNLVEAKTIIQKTNTNSWTSWWGSNGSNINYKINYFIKIPKTNNINLFNKYGDIDLTNLEGIANIKCKYGNVHADKLLNAENTIELDYCGNSEFDYINAAYIDADYSKIFVNNAEEIKSNTDYTTLKIEKIKNLSFNSDYGSVSAEKANNISGESDYASMKFGVVNKKLDINTKYGAIRVRNLANSFEKVTINGAYSGIKIGTESTNNFKFNVDLGYSGFNYPEEHVNMYKSIKKSSKKYYEGVFGNDENTNASININSRYGGVSLKLND